MAVAEMMKSDLRLVFYEGEDVLTGKPIYRSKLFSVKMSATTDQLYNVAESIASLQERPLYYVERQDKYEINQE